MSVKKLSTHLLHIPSVILARHYPGPAECSSTPPPPSPTIRLQMFQYFAVVKADVLYLVSLIVIFATKFCPYFLFCYMPTTYLVRRSAQWWL